MAAVVDQVVAVLAVTASSDRAGIGSLTAVRLRVDLVSKAVPMHPVSKGVISLLAVMCASTIGRMCAGTAIRGPHPLRVALSTLATQVLVVRPSLSRGEVVGATQTVQQHVLLRLFAVPAIRAERDEGQPQRESAGAGRLRP